MKENINNALNEINDKYIEEANNATHLQHNTARTIRNIAIPVASAAAIAGLCLGLSKLGAFSNSGVDLLPADTSTSNGAGDTSIIANDPYQYEFIGYEPIIPDTIPLVLQTSEHIESIIFGSEFPEMIYADENSAMFTDGISGLYVFDFSTEEISFAADIYTTFDLALDDFPEKIGTNYGGDSWSGIELFAGADGTPYCSIAYHSDMTVTGSGLPMQSQWQTKYYEIDTETLTLIALPTDEMTIPLYEGLKEIPYNEYGDYCNISLNAAYISDTEEFVYIRHSSTDIDLLPRYSMEQIELRRWTAEEVNGEAMDGGYYPFGHKVGKDVELYSFYYTSHDEVVTNSHGIRFDGVEFNFDVWADVARLPAGRYTLYGDIVSLVEETSGYKWMYRIVGDSLIQLDIIGEQSTTADIELNYYGDLYKDSDMLAEEVLPTAYEQMASYRDEVIRKLESDTLNEANRQELEAELESYQTALAEIEAKMKEAGYFTAGVQEFLASLDPRVASAVQEFISAEPSAEFWGTSSAEISYGIVTAKAINMFNEHILSLDDGAAEMILSDKQLVYSMCLNSYWKESDATISDDYSNEADELNSIITDLILSSELSYSGSADMKNMLYPLDEKYNYITTYFGYDTFRDGSHYGIDIADEGIGGANIYAVQDGMVIATQDSSGSDISLGNYVLIDHGNGYCTLYAHCYEVYVTEGDEVKRGDTIASVGTTGLSTGNHLHFEVRKDGIAVDPLSFPYGNVAPIKFDSFEAALKYAFENAGEPAIPDFIAQPIDCESSTGVRVYSDYSEYTSDTPNANVFAADAGEIIFANYTGEADKVCIAIMHDGYVTVYRGLSSYTYEAGEHVQMGWVIGKADDEGKMRFELRTDANVIMNTKGYCEKIDPAMNDFPQSGNAKAAFCDKILYSNEPSVLFDSYKIKAYAVSANGVTTVLKNEDGSAEKYGNLFFNENEALLDVEYIGNGCLVTSRTAELADGSYIRKEYYLNGSYIDTILRYNVTADGTETLIETINVDYLMTDEDIAVYEYDSATCRPDLETVNNAIAQVFADAGEPNIPAQLHAPIDDNAGYISEYFYGDYRYGFGGYYGHKGVDISAEYGTDVNSAADGKVIAAVWYGDYGDCVIIMHDGYATVYGHLSDMFVKEGDTVAAGQLIGAVGSTGRSTGNHLHFEIRTAPEEQINPIDYLPYTE